jgi:trk system potassium uptake protein TrkA
MLVAIAGAGNVGLFIANELVDGGNEVLLIENDLEVVKRIPDRAGITVVAADACEVSSLKEAGLERCDVLVAATGDDEDNLVVSLLAKQEFAVPRVIARVNHPKNHWLFNESWGVDISVSTPHLITALVGEAVSVGRLVRLFQLEAARSLVEVASPTTPRREPGRARHRDPRATIVAVVRDDHVVMRAATPCSCPATKCCARHHRRREQLRTALTGARGPQPVGRGPHRSTLPRRSWTPAPRSTR